MSITGQLVLASNNQGKLLELSQLFAPLGLQLIPQAQMGIGEAPEPFFTFIENALAKARHAAKESGLPAIADDAGLCVQAFDGQPGVDTAYYATRFGYEKGDDNNILVLLQQLQGHTNRRATLVSTLVAVRHEKDPEPLIAVGRALGEITLQPMGRGGFGFDPVMWVSEYGKTFAEMTSDEKNSCSHRGKAARAMVALLQEYWL